MKIDEYVNIAGNDTLGCFGFQLINGAREALNISVSKQYENGSLLVTRSEDEDGVTLFEFKDRLERTVLERRIESRLKGDKQLSDTYYIYDDLGKLCAVLPPALSDQLSVGNIPAENSICMDICINMMWRETSWLKSFQEFHGNTMSIM